MFNVISIEQLLILSLCKVYKVTALHASIKVNNSAHIAAQCLLILNVVESFFRRPLGEQLK